MKIDVIGTRGFPGIQGGVERHCERLYPLMKNVKIRVFRRKPFINKAYKDTKYDNIQFLDLPSTRVTGLEAVFHSFQATLISAFSRSQVVHIHNIGPAMFAPLLRLFGKKVVLTYHSANYEHDKWNWFGKLVLRLSEKIALSASNRIIFVNKFQLDKYSNKVKAKSVYIPNGIVPLQRNTATDFLQKLDVEPAKYILSVGRITPEKGFDLLIQAYNKLKTDVKLVIAGAPDLDTAYFDNLKAMAGKNVVFAGFVDGGNLSQLYSHAQVYVLSSRIEGFPLVLLEAINFGLPLLVSDIEATHLLNLPKKSYFKASDVYSMQLKLGEFLAENRESYLCRTIDVADYDWKKIADQTCVVYKMLENE